MNLAIMRTTFAVALVLVLTATGLWAAGAEEGSAAAADKKYVIDPTTGKPVVAPEYGGTITYTVPALGLNSDPYFGHSDIIISGVTEKLGIGNWGVDRDEWDFRAGEIQVPYTIGRLAESWEISPDGLTYTFHIRKGVHWLEKPLMNGNGHGRLDGCDEAEEAIPRCAAVYARRLLCVHNAPPR